MSLAPATIRLLLLALVAALGLALLVGDRSDADPGGHGGAPAALTGPHGRSALDGEWFVAHDPADRGARSGWAAGTFPGAAVRLPHSPNAGRITGAAGVRSHAGSMAWYRTRLVVPEEGRYAIRFESVNHDAIVWIDGRRVATHRGEYLPFEVRPTLAAGEHALVVRADWRDPARMKRQGWHRSWFNYGGINREVTIRRLAASEIAAPTIRTRLRTDGTGRTTAAVDLTAQVRNLAGRRSIAATATLEHGDRRVEVPFPPVEVGHGGSRTTRTTVQIPDPQLWSPEDPRLWTLTVRVPGESGWDARVGLREVRRRGTQLLLNGRPIRLVGASLHEDVPGRGDALRPEDMDALVRDLRALGANATRAQHPLNPALLERLDAAGILLWQGIGPVDAPGAWTSRGPRLARQARERVRVTLRQAQTHPSILVWNLANEVAGDGHPAGQVPFVVGASAELKARDPGRPVALDIWGAHPPRRDSAMYRRVDAIGWTNYIGWYEATHQPAAVVERLIRRRLDELRRVFPHKVIAVTEFGAEGNDRNPEWSPGGLGFQARLLRTHLRTYRAMPDIAGMLVWNLRDFGVAPSFAGGSIHRQAPGIRLVRGLNQKGLWTYDGRPKPAVAAVRAQLRRAR